MKLVTRILIRDLENHNLASEDFYEYYECLDPSRGLELWI
jgi:hypothetical protein